MLSAAIRTLSFEVASSVVRCTNSKIPLKLHQRVSSDAIREYERNREKRADHLQPVEAAMDEMEAVWKEVKEARYRAES